MIPLLILAPLLRGWVLEHALGGALLSPHPETSLPAAAAIGLLLLLRLALYGLGPGWMATWMLRQVLR